MAEFNDPTNDPVHYKWGLFYCNQTDPRIFVPKRFGFGYSLNFSKPYVLIGFALVLLIILYRVIFS